MDVLDEFYGRNPWARGYFDDATQKERQLMKIQIDIPNRFQDASRRQGSESPGA
ncbi:hypothetical protein Ppb6_00546 [Photorhabdus australis subsp. thailandensis]|uniref:Uncharacterized protein n=1 Tax=Photorhabdus australis subsp. thailandensis TaxID=2805096 RepID=A0A1C0U8M8_9GAMM|nr:hypothetical protein Ppb6_00546 [Photorhabdus australis subsp. thailandensis]